MTRPYDSGISSRGDLQLRSGAPAAAREIREFDGAAALRGRADAEIDDRAERRGIVDVHVGRLPCPQALDQAIVLDVVHAAVAGAGGPRLDRAHSG